MDMGLGEIVRRGIIVVSILAGMSLPSIALRSQTYGNNPAIAFVHDKNIYSVTSDCSNLVQLTSDEKDNGFSSWSPNRTKIAFDSREYYPASGDYSDSEIYVIKAL